MRLMMLSLAFAVIAAGCQSQRDVEIPRGDFQPHLAPAPLRVLETDVPGDSARADGRLLSDAGGPTLLMRPVAAGRASKPADATPSHVLLADVEGGLRLSATTEPAAGSAGGKSVCRGPVGGGLWPNVVRDFREAPAVLWDDTKSLLTVQNGVVLLAAGGASATVRYSGMDDSVEHHCDRNDVILPVDADRWFAALGNPASHFGVAAAMYALAVAGENTKMYETSKTLISALAINGLLTMGFKLAAGTDSPNGEAWAWPSGHTSSTVAFAAVMDEAYGPWVGLPLYGLSGMVALSRIDDREHHLSDVVFGAVLGYVVGKSVARNHHPQIFGMELLPYMEPQTGTAGVALMKRF